MNQVEDLTDHLHITEKKALLLRLTDVNSNNYKIAKEFRLQPFVVSVLRNNFAECYRLWGGEKLVLIERDEKWTEQAAQK